MIDVREQQLTSLVNTGEIIKCPHCGGEFLHHEIIAVNTRNSEDEPGRKITIKGTRNPVVQENHADFIGRRDDIRIEFSCELCDETCVLALVQHKGTSYLGWIG